MRRLNETDWSSVYDNGALHKQALKEVVESLREQSVSALNYSKVYKQGADYILNNKDIQNMSYKKAVQSLNDTVYRKARSKYGENEVDDYSYIIDDDRYYY